MSDGLNREGFTEPPPVTAATPGQAAEPEIPVQLVRLWLCGLCLDGDGGECHSPGCSLWLNRAPDLALRDNPMVTLLGTVEPEDDAAQHPQPAPGVTLTVDGIGVIQAPGTRQPKPAPELRAAMAETRKVAILLDDFTHAVIDLDDGARLVAVDRLAKAAHAVRKKAGLPAIGG